MNDFYMIDENDIERIETARGCLPIAIADSVPELAKITGATVDSIYSNITHQKRGQIKNGSYKRIDIGDVEEDESTCLE